MKVVFGLGRWLLHEAVEAIAPVIGGCAGALVGNQMGNPEVGRVVGDGVQRAVDYFGMRIVERWLAQFLQQPPEQIEQSLCELASMPLEEIRCETQELLANLHLSFSDADRQVALDYLTAIPQVLSRSLEPIGGFTRRTQLASRGPLDAERLLKLLPAYLPPYGTPCDLPGTPYRLEKLIGMGGFGAVYRAVDPKMPFMPLALKFCRDSASIPMLRRERDNFESLIQAGTDNWSPRVVRLFGYNLEHPTPYLVYEWIPGGDLAAAIAERGERPTTDEVLRWIRGIAEALAFAHCRGIVHRDLKPANILLAPDGPKLADFGIGGTAVLHIEASATVSMLRGAGTPLYMAPEQRRGEAPDPRHDIYSLGVIWYQLFLGDSSRELHPGWVEELRDEVEVSVNHLDLIHRCVGVMKKRPADATELLRLLDAVEKPRKSEAKKKSPHVVGLLRKLNAPLEQLNAVMLKETLRQFREAHVELEKADRTPLRTKAMTVFVGYFSVGILCGLTVALPIPFIAIHGSVLAIAIAVPLIAVVGAALSCWLTFLLCRWYLRIARRTRIRPIQDQMNRNSELILQAFPEVANTWGGRDALLHGPSAQKICEQLEQFI